ncbi:MAG: hypothetical protein JRI59_01300 [Deltaproteobacteria bacterium]|nr:hypothetical protein [Deltaproteobacteria bacterium]
MTERPFITIGFSSHRLEVLPEARRVMENHDAIVLEEAPEPDFPRVLAGEMGIEEYLADKDLEFPRYSRAQLHLLRDLVREGKRIFQSEPYLERLIRIHELLARGLTRPEVESRPGLKVVYEAEARASAALLAFYTRAHSAPFPRVVAAVRDFAQADAARFRLRDELRARDLLPFLRNFPRLYVEAGYIHLFLLKKLRQLLAGRAGLRPVFLLAAPSRQALGRPRPLGPGDLLTLFYIFGLKVKKEKEDLLAARSLIYIKLLGKEELAPDPGGAGPRPGPAHAPHG